MVIAVTEFGVINLEITLNSPGAEDLIRLTRDRVGSQGNVGAGTILNLFDLDRARAAGASFIVTPTLNPEVLRACATSGMPVMSGALSPGEIVSAWELGAAWVKVFPADLGGPAQIRAIKATFPDIRLMPTGGVTVETLPAFLKAGADAFGVGSPLFDPRQAAAGNWDWFRKQAQRFVAAFQSAV